ncbi:MAG: hypothetical protein WAN51_01695 [Alphaproteobacteria bacterium]
MTDNVTTETKPSPPSLPDLSPEQLAGARADWVARGLDAAQFDAALRGETQTAPIQETTALVPDVLDPATKHPSLGNAEVDAMQKEWTRLGLDPAAFAKAAEADGFKLIETETTAEKDEHATAYDLDRDFATAEYKVQYINDPVARNLDTTLLAEFNANATATMAAISINPGLGAGVIEHAMAAVQKYDAISNDAGKELYARECRSIIQHQLRDVPIEKAGDAIAAMFKQTASPDGKIGGFAAALVTSRAILDPFVFLSLYNHSQHLQQFLATYPERT